MAVVLQAGDDVVLVRIPDWLVHDLPESEKQELISCVGRKMKIEKIDRHGYCWIGFGTAIDVGDDTHYSGHSFCVPADCLKKS